MKKLFTLIVLAFGSFTAFSQATLVSQFDFNGNLNDKLAVSTCTDYNNANFTYVNGAFTFTANTSGGGGGMIVKVPDASFTEDDYSISIDLQFNEVSSYAKIIDFMGQTSDDGLYFYSNLANLYPLGSGNTNINANTYYTVLLTRSVADDSVKVYIIQNNQLLLEIYDEDTNGDYITTLSGTDRVFDLFHDDLTTTSEYTDSGAVRSVRIWNGIVKLSDVCNSIVSYTASPASKVICNSGSATITCNGSPTTFTAYAFSPSGSVGTPVVLSPTITTTYSITGDYYSTGCNTPSATISLTVSPGPTVTAVSSTSLLCTGQQATLTANGANTYTWNTGPTTTVIAVSPTITTTYTVNGTNTAGCTGSTTITQSVSTCAAIAEFGVGSSDFVVFPNPNNGTFHLNLNSVSENVYIEIYNSVGQLILKQKAETENSINLQQQSSGIYILRITENGKVMSYTKVVRE